MFKVINCGRYIPLTQGQKTLVDVGDFDALTKYKWHARKNGHNFYAIKFPNEYMARFLMKAQPGQIIDHANRNSLDNRRVNLRIAEKFQNNANCRRRSDHQFVGVEQNGTRGKVDALIGWRGYASHKGKRFHTKTFRTAIEAAVARDELAKKYHGAFAVLNFPEEK